MTAFTDPLSLALEKTGMGNYPGPMASLYNSPLGTPVYSDLSIAAGSYSVDGVKYSYNEIHIPNALFSVTKKKRVVVTSIKGASGDVFEYTGEDSAQISCMIKFYGTNLNYPTDYMKNIYMMLESNQPLQINSWYLNQLGIYYVVVTDYELPQKTGNIAEQEAKINMKEIDTVKYPTLLNG